VVVNPLSNIADRIPLVPRRRRPRYGPPRVIPSERVIAEDDDNR